MLSRLEIHNYILIDSLETDFPEGLIIISGQTGAGKSILLGALNLLAGGKADASMISEGAQNCIVEAVFTAVPDSVKGMLEEAGVEWNDGELVIRRLVAASGRSRAFINDCPVPVQLLSAAATSLFDIHSQRATMDLLDPFRQMDLLDRFAGNLELRGRYSASYSRLIGLKDRSRDLSETLARLNREKDYNEAQFRQLDSAAIKEGEMEELEAEQKKLANAEDIQTGLCGILERLNPSDGESLSADSSLKEAVKVLNRLSAYVPAAEGLSSRLESLRIELEDVLSEISDIVSTVDSSPDRLAKVDDRMSLIYSLYQKFSCSGEAELIALRDDYRNRLVNTGQIEEELAALQEEIRQEEKICDKLASALTESRLKASAPFSAKVQEMIRGLELQQAVFSVDISRTQNAGRYGRDNIVFLFSSTGRNALPVAKCASGGEMSRIMLCLKALMARFVSMPTLIFDEIDTGVSGSVADKMGSMICSMGKDMQVFAITHLPQVAAKGDAHYLVTKAIQDNGRTSSSIRKLSEQERVMEIARMLSGSTVTEAAVANAVSLLEAK
ncbi:MAG: DNA repair protein RecN [Candidatus Cryptobacteroides sp.]|nr:DNA repair protein RecN [Candidatus Cryptobacteroides sp.]